MTIPRPDIRPDGPGHSPDPGPDHSPDPGPLLCAAGVVKRYGSLTVLDDVGFHAGAGEAVGIVGPNGAGKTTLFGALAGSFPITGGQIRFDGTDITMAPARARNIMGIARTYQVPHPFHGMTLFENVLVAARAGGGWDGQAAIDATGDILRRTGLLPLANTPAAAVGLLDLKRLEVARALATNPRVILLDEIGGGLTEGELIQLIDLIGGLRASGLTIVWIEHILHALLKVVTRLVCMAEGRVLAEGDPQEVMSDPAVRSAYFGSDPS